MNDDETPSFIERVEQIRKTRETTEEKRKRHDQKMQAVLEDPTEYHVSEIMEAVETLDEDEQDEWIENHPEAREQIVDTCKSVFKSLAEMFETIPDEAIEEYEQRQANRIDNGLYKNTILETPNGDRTSAGVVNYWGESIDRTVNIDLRLKNVPDGADLVGSRIEIYDEGDQEEPIFDAEIVKEGGVQDWGKTTTQTVVVNPDT